MLESSSKRLLPKPTTLKTKRALSKVVWNHGPSKLKHPAPGAVQQTSSRYAFDFLYPAHTLSQLRSFAVSTPPRSRRDNRNQQRGYSSQAEARKAPVEQFQDAFVLQENPLQRLLGSDATDLYDRAWIVYNQQNHESKKNLRIPILKYLTGSTRPVDAERILEVTEMFKNEQRTLDVESAETHSYAATGRYNKAIQTHDRALKSYGQLCSSSFLLARLVEDSRWEEALQLLLKTRDVAGSDENIFDDLAQMPKLVEHARELLSLVRFSEAARREYLHTEDEEFDEIVDSDFDMQTSRDLTAEHSALVLEDSSIPDEPLSRGNKVVDLEDIPPLEGFEDLDMFDHYNARASRLEESISGPEATRRYIKPELQEAAVIFLAEALCNAPKQSHYRDLREISQYLLKSGNLPLTMWQLIIDKLLTLRQNMLAVKCYRTQRHKLRGKEMFRKSLLLYLLDVFRKAHDHVGMDQILTDWTKGYNKVSRKVYRLCMAEFANRGDTEAVEAACDQYEKSWGEKYMQTPVDVSQLLQAYAKKGEPHKVTQYFDHMEKWYGVQPDLACWNITINAHCLQEDLDAALDRLETLCNSSTIEPDVFSFTPVIGACAARADTDGVLYLIEKAKSHNIQPSVGMIECLVLCYAKNHMFIEAEKVCEELASLSTEDATKSWNHLIQYMGNVRDVDGVNRLLQRMAELRVPYSAFTYSALMNSLCKVDLPDRAQEIVNRVLPAAGMKPTSYHYAILLGGYLATNQLGRFFHTFRKMRPELKRNTSTKLLFLHARAKREAYYALDFNDKLPNSEPRVEFRSAELPGILHVPDADSEPSGVDAPKDPLIEQLAPKPIERPRWDQDNLQRRWWEETSELKRAEKRAKFQESVDLRKADEERSEFEYKRAYALYLELLKRATPGDNTDRARYGNIRTTSSMGFWQPYTQLMLFLFGRNREPERVTQTLKQLGSDLPGVHRARMALGTLSALMESDYQSGNFSGVVDTWKLAFNEAKASNKTILSRQGQNQPVQASQYTLVYHFSLYMKALSQLSRVDDIAITIRELEKEGFSLDRTNWNLYIQILIRHYRHVLAFQVCEERLIGRFIGWSNATDRRRAGQAIPLNFRRQSQNRSTLRPLSVTLGLLILNYSKLISWSVDSVLTERMLAEIRTKCPKTVRAITSLENNFGGVKIKDLEEYGATSRVYNLNRPKAPINPARKKTVS